MKRQVTPGTRICMAVKADAYGHGAVPVVRAAVEEGVESFGVATVEEAVELRSAEVTSPILLFSLTVPEEIPALVEYGLEPFVADMQTVRAIEREAERGRRKIGVHVKIDTGMGRIGCRPEEAVTLCGAVTASQRLELAGICTHFPGADETEPSFTRRQIERFRGIVAEIRKRGIHGGIVHAANSAGALRFQQAHFDMIRPGIVLYGYPPETGETVVPPFLPVMELESRLVFIKRVAAGSTISYGMTYRPERDTIIGTVPAGYADGFSRSLSNRGSVLIGGKSYPIAGRVCMDQFMVDLGAENSAKRYEKVTLFGPDPAGPSAESIARLAGTIPYEITCGISGRVPRVYTDAPADVPEAQLP